MINDYSNRVVEYAGFLAARNHVTDAGFEIINEVRGKPLGVFQEDYGFIAQKDNSIICAFHGIDSIAEALEGMDWFHMDCPCCPEYKCEAGAGEAYETIRGNLKDLLDPHSRSDSQITVIGHSLGASIATLHALDLNLNSTFEQPISLYTYASPRVCSKELAHYFSTLGIESWRIANVHDLVPKTPLREFNYEHVGEEVTLDFDYSNVITNHEIASYYKFLSGS